ncbi:MAG: NEW3 domain-containing protein [Chitinophagales bacterium]
MTRNAEFEAIPEVGMTRLLLDLQKLPVSGTVLQVGAHPDDEDNALLAYLVKGLHLNAYYLVANWGEGGQNQIGAELYEALGVLRAQELASARMIDGATQLCLGTHDFGFSKTGAEALAKWGHDECLGRMVRFFRLYRPEIVITHHDTTTGHGQHQAIGTLVVEAFDAAGDPARFPEQLANEGLHPWQVRKLYVTDKNPTVRVNVGRFSPALGRSYHEVGMLSRSMHKSQGMVAPGLKGDQVRGYKLVKSALPDRRAEEQALTDGLDFSLGEFLEGVEEEPAALSPFHRKLAELTETISTVLASFSPFAPWRVAPEVLRGLGLVRELKNIVAGLSLTEAGKDLIQPRLLAKERDFVRVVEDLAATSLEVAAGDTDVVPGQTVTVTVRFWNRGVLPVEQVRLALNLPPGWLASGDAPVAAALGENQKAEARFEVAVPPDASFTGAFDPAPVTVAAEWQLLGTRLETAGAPDLRVVPAVAVELVPEKLMLPVSGAATVKAVTVKLRNNTTGPLAGRVKLALPAGWTATGDPAFAMEGRGLETSVNLRVSVPGGTPEGAYRLRAAAEWDGGRCAAGYQVISYPHIETRYLYKPAEATAAVIGVKVAPGLRVGYVSSGSDNVPDHLRQMGVDVWLLGAEDLAAADLRRYDTIVLGIRAYLNRPDLVANNQRLLEYVENGGNLIVQYNKTGEWKSAFAPFPLSVGSRRVTAEEAQVTVLQPEHPLFNFPNKLTARDWDGWIQERGLYFPDEWAEEYTPLVAMNDENEPVQRGSWLIARYGKGTYIYTALVWYRQLDGLVPGAYRAFANMISLPRMK